MEAGKYIDVNNTGHSNKLFIKSSSRDAQALHTLNGLALVVSKHLTKLYQLNCSPALLLLNPSKSYSGRFPAAAGVADPGFGFTQSKAV